MTTPDELPPPLDDDLADLLGSVADVSPSPEAMARVRARVDATLALPPGGPEAPRPPSGSPSPEAPSTPAPASGALLAKVATLAFLIGAGSGATVMHLAREPQRTEVRIVRQVVYEPAPPPSPMLASPGVDASVAADAGTRAEPRDAAVVVVDAGGESLASGRDRVLADENALVTRAQSALARGRAGEALEALSEHQRRFPGGQFVEEREAMTIQALVRLGRIDAARARAERFRARFPGSMLLRAVEAAVGPSE